MTKRLTVLTQMRGGPMNDKSSLIWCWLLGVLVYVCVPLDWVEFGGKMAVYFFCLSKSCNGWPWTRALTSLGTSKQMTPTPNYIVLYILLLHTVLLHSKCLFWKKLCTQIHITMCKNSYLRRQLEDCRSYSDQWYSTNHFFSQTDSATHSTTPTELDTACLKPCFRQTLVTSHKLLTRRTRTALITNILIDTVPY